MHRSIIRAGQASLTSAAPNTVFHNRLTGSDATGALGDPSKPFASLQAAVDALETAGLASGEICLTAHDPALVQTAIVPVSISALNFHATALTLGGTIKAAPGHADLTITGHPLISFSEISLSSSAAIRHVNILTLRHARVQAVFANAWQTPEESSNGGFGGSVTAEYCIINTLEARGGPGGWDDVGSAGSGGSVSCIHCAGGFMISTNAGSSGVGNANGGNVTLIGCPDAGDISTSPANSGSGGAVTLRNSCAGTINYASAISAHASCAVSIGGGVPTPSGSLYNLGGATG